MSKTVTQQQSVSTDWQANPELYPWLTSNWQKLLQYQNTRQIPHALLLSGNAGLGKFELALFWTKALLCETLSNSKALDIKTQACGQCAACELFAANTHPDFMLIAPEEEGKAIKVGQIRALVEFLALTQSRASRRVIVVNPAEAMNINAANSLLKTLEGPPENTIIILVSSKPHTLPATIRSRCQHFPVTVSNIPIMQHWLSQKGTFSQNDVDLALSLTENTPLNALFYLDSSILGHCEDLLNDWQKLASGEVSAPAVAEKWLKQPGNLPIRLVYTWLVDMIRYYSVNYDNKGRLDDNSRTLFYYNDNTVLQTLANTIPLRRLFVMYDKVIEILKFEHTSLNKQLHLESLLIQWSLIAQRK